MVKISVIVPVYNVERYIRKTLDSLLDQTMIDDIEVIMIDDGSTDNSRFIIDEYAEKYDNFHAYHRKNQGPAIARNYGIDLARGEYVHFMDADDYLPRKAYETLYNFNPQNDFIVGNVLKFGEYNIWENVLFNNAFKDFKGDVKLFRITDFPNVLWDTITCNKLFKKEFLDKNNIRFINKNIYYEDLLFSLEAYILAESIGFSRNIFYFWRFRKDKSSITQRQDDIKNFEHRIEILKIYDSIMNKYDLSPDLKNLVYSKWLNHDLKTSFKKFGNYPGKYYYKLIDEANELLDIIPDEIMDDLNFYLKILYKIVKNRDVPSLLSFAHLEDDLKKDPQMELDIGEEYLQYIDLDCNSYEDEFEVFVSDVFNDDKNLYLEFEYHVDFLAKSCPHKINIYLIENDENIQLNVINNHVIVIPLDLLKDKYHSKIKVSYQTGTFCYESFIRNYSRKSIRYANYDIDLGIGINNILYLDVKRKTQNNVVINKISFDDGEFIFNCEALNPVRNVVLTNYVTYRKIVYPAIHSTTSNRFIFVVPFNDLKGNIINKWELNCPDSYNSIVLDKEFRFELENCKIVFKNKRNKIYVANKYIIESDIINKLKSKNKELTKQNKKLSKENAKLNNTVQEFKSRKLIKMADSVKRRF